VAPLTPLSVTLFRGEAGIEAPHVPKKLVEFVSFTGGNQLNLRFNPGQPGPNH
jgi:hypothetical protein